MSMSRVGFVFLLALVAVAEASSSTHSLRKFKGKHIQKNLVLKRFGKADVSALLQKPNPVPAAANTVDADDADDSDSDDDDDRKPGSPPPLISKLKTIFGELKERRENMVQLEASLKQLETTMKESRRMARVATTKKAKETYAKQVKDTEEVYKDTYQLYETSYQEATGAAKVLENEMKDAADLTDRISSEAKTQLKHYGLDHLHSALEKKDADDDDEPKKRDSLLATGKKVGDADEDEEDEDDDQDQ